ncbi:MAG: ATP-binding protein [Myxococcota bacterium]
MTDENGTRYLAHRRFAVTFAFMITATGLVAFLCAASVVRPLMLSYFRPHVAKLVILPVVSDAIERSTGEPLKDVSVRIEDEHVLIEGTAAGKRVQVGPYRVPYPPFYVAFTLVSILCCIIGVASALTFALPWTRRLQHVVDAFDAVASGRTRTRIPVHTEDLISQISKGFNAMAERIESTLEEREQLLQAVSHELATPVARIRLLLSLERVQKVPALVAELEELEALVDELVTYVELDSHHKVRTHLPIDIGEAARDVVNSHREWSRHRIAMSGEDVSLFIPVDERDVRRTLSNLLRNAERYAKQRIAVAILFSEGALRLTVDDDGPGIEPELRRAVFLPFSRTDESRNRETGGVGLGLALVERIARRYGGSARVEQSPALGGARFIIEWRVAAEETEPTAPAQRGSVAYRRRPGSLGRAV